MSWRGQAPRDEYRAPSAPVSHFRVRVRDYERMKAALDTQPALRGALTAEQEKSSALGAENEALKSRLEKMQRELDELKAALADLKAEQAESQEKLDRLPTVASRHAEVLEQNQRLKGLLRVKGIDFSHLFQDKSPEVATAVSDSGTTGSGSGAAAPAAP